MSRFIEFEASAPLDDTHSSTEDSTRVSDEEFIDNRPEDEISTNGDFSF